MDKYEFNVKVEQIKKLVNKGDYEAAMKIADTIDWRRVRNVSILSMVATIYEKNEEYQEAKDILLLAFERAPIGKRLLYKLAELAIKEGNIGEAEDYYREFSDLAPDDPRQYLLRYMILGAKGAPVQQLIHTLEQYCNIELDEKWLYELAELYHEAGMVELCVMACDKIMMMFGLGKYVDKAMELKIQYAPLTKYQMDLEENRDKYEARLRAVEQEYEVPAPGYEFDGPVTRRPQPIRKPEPIEQEEEVSVYGERQPYRPVRPRRTEADLQPAAEETAAAAEPAEPAAAAEEMMPEPEPVEEMASADSQQVQEQIQEQEEVVSQEIQEQPEPEASAEEAVAEGAVSEEAGEMPQEETAQPQESQTETAESEIAPEAAEMTVTQQPELSSDELAARVHEAEVQANLARELSRLSGAAFSEESHQAQTRVLRDIRSLQGREGADETAQGMLPMSNHLMIESEDPQEGFQMALDALKKLHKELGIKNQVAKITGGKLNEKGVLNLSDKLTGKDLIVEYAGDMDDRALRELDQLMARDESGMNVILIDNQEQLEAIHNEYPGLARRFECIGETGRPAGQKAPAKKEQPTPEAVKAPVVQKNVIERAAATLEQEEPKAASQPAPQPKAATMMKAAAAAKPAVKQQAAPTEADLPEEEMDIDEFAQYACQYASEIDCSISGKSMLALYERIEIMEEDGIPLTRENAENLIEEAADRAEHPPIGQRVKSLFASKYNKEGLLILREEHFI